MIGKLFIALLYIVVVIKFAFLGFALYTRYYETKIGEKHKQQENPKAEYWKTRTEFAYTALMSLMLLILFKPGGNYMYLLGEKHVTLLLFIFGFVNLFMANWSLFFHQESAIGDILKTIQRHW
jgi:hypothetical protein